MCPYRPAARQAIRERMQKLGEAIKPYPYIDGVSLEDEQKLVPCSIWVSGASAARRPKRRM